MSEYNTTKGELKINWTEVSSLISALGLILAAAALFYSAQQIKLGRQIAKSQFMIEFANTLNKYDTIQLKLIEHGEWWWTDSSGPVDYLEWYQLERYMGLLEQLDTWYVDNIISIEEIDNNFSHRLKPISTHPEIRKKLLEDEPKRWPRFLNLIEKLEGQPNFRELGFDIGKKELE